jgi:hypothetical protein
LPLRRFEGRVDPPLRRGGVVRGCRVGGVVSVVSVVDAVSVEASVTSWRGAVGLRFVVEDDGFRVVGWLARRVP